MEKLQTNITMPDGKSFDIVDLSFLPEELNLKNLQNWMSREVSSIGNGFYEQVADGINQALLNGETLTLSGLIAGMHQMVDDITDRDTKETLRKSVHFMALSLSPGAAYLSLGEQLERATSALTIHAREISARKH